MLTIFSDYVAVATRLASDRRPDRATPAPRSDRGRWRAAPQWRDRPDLF